MDCSKEKHIEDILYLLDDFLKISPTQNLCEQQLDPFLMLCYNLGLPMAPEKTLVSGRNFGFSKTSQSYFTEDSVLYSAS